MVIVAVCVTCIPLDFSKTPWLYVGEELVPCVSCASGFAAVATRYALGIRHPRVGHEHFHGQLGVITPYCPVDMLYLNLVWIPYLHVGSFRTYVLFRPPSVCAIPLHNTGGWRVPPQFSVGSCAMISSEVSCAWGCLTVRVPPSV